VALPAVVAFQYRLSAQRTVTPLDTMADARDAMRWLRRQADGLGLDPHRVVAGMPPCRHAASPAYGKKQGASSEPPVPNTHPARAGRSGSR
jgi:hypothetical protein